MSDEIDPELTRLFVAADEALPPEQFVAEAVQRIRRNRRLSMVRRLCVVSAVVVAAAGVAPFVADFSVDVVRYSGGGIEGFADLLVSPIGAAASMVVGFIILRRVRATRR